MTAAQAFLEATGERAHCVMQFRFLSVRWVELRELRAIWECPWVGGWRVRRDISVADITVDSEVHQIDWFD